jgi:DNA-binding winged helix-turn-helix (wHTH) protein
LEDLGDFLGSTGPLGMILRFAAFALDTEQRRLMRGGADVHLTPKAFNLLALLVAEAPRVVPKAELHERIWPGTFVTDATLASIVKEIRRALDEGEGAASRIRTAHGVGYAFASAIVPGTQAAQRPPVSATSHWIDERGRSVMLWPGENMIGREPSSAVSIDLAGVSRRHARILVTRDGATIEDLGSKNGTRIGEQVLTGVVHLHDGDQIHVGPAILVYRISAVGLSTATRTS